MCGIAAVLLAALDGHASSELYEALGMLQHRGQDAAGIVTCKDGRMFQVKENGMVRDVFTRARLIQLQGRMGVGHVRYPTAGSSSASEAQPFYVNAPYGMALAHNGNITNGEMIIKQMHDVSHRHINTSSDSELLLNIFADELQKLNKPRHLLDPDDIFYAVRCLHKRAKGGYACVVMVTDVGLVAFRDPHGIRPLVWGTRMVEGGSKSDVCVSSESHTLDFLGYTLEGDVRPGAAMICNVSGQVLERQCHDNPVVCPCIFEYVYFARPDSIINGISVYHARLNQGDMLAKNIAKNYPDLEIDVVIPVPDTSRAAALQLSHALRKPYREGFIKNRYVGRTFIMPGQQARRAAVRRKLNAMRSEFENKNVLLVDDSIVRGTTSKEIIVMAREAGAKNVYFASASPAIKHPNVYGIDMPSRAELVAHERSDSEIAEFIGADAVIYQTLEDLKEACRSLNPNVEDFEVSVFTGEYITKDIGKGYLEDIASERNDANRNSCATDIDTVGLHNYRKI